MTRILRMLSVFNWEYILIPFGTTNTRYSLGGGYFVGHTNFYIFGIRVCRIQRTNPWE